MAYDILASKYSHFQITKTIGSILYRESFMSSRENDSSFLILNDAKRKCFSLVNQGFYLCLDFCWE